MDDDIVHNEVEIWHPFSNHPHPSRRIFQVRLNVSEFLVEEISVLTDEANIIVEASHEERSDSSGFISRQFRRRFEMPTGINSENIQSVLTSEGVLTITAQLVPTTDESPEMVVPILVVPSVLFETTDPNRLVTTPAA